MQQATSIKTAIGNICCGNSIPIHPRLFAYILTHYEGMVGHKLSFEAALSGQHSEKRNKSFKGEEEGMSSDGIVGHNVALIEMMSLVYASSVRTMHVP